MQAQRFTFYPWVSLLTLTLAVSGCQTAKHRAIAVTKEKKSVAPSVYFMTAHSPKALTPKPKSLPWLRDSTATLQTQLNNNPKDVNLQLALAQIDLGDGNLAGAQKLAQSVLNQNFANRDAKIVMAHVAYLEGRYLASRALLELIGGVNAPESEALNLLGCLDFHDGEAIKAEQMWAAAVKKNSADLAAWMNIGISLLRRDQFKAAQDQFKVVLARWSDNPDAKLHLAIAYAQQGNTADAIPLYQEVRKVAPQSQIVLFDLAAAQYRAKEYKNAVDTLRQFLALKNLTYSNHDAALALLEEIRREKGSDTKLSNAELDRMVSDEANNKTLSPHDEKADGPVMSNVGFYN